MFSGTSFFLRRDSDDGRRCHQPSSSPSSPHHPVTTSTTASTTTPSSPLINQHRHRPPHLTPTATTIASSLPKPTTFILSAATTIAYGALGFKCHNTPQGLFRGSKGAHLVVMPQQGLRLGCAFMGKGAFG
ncbi:hypothetical protein Tco_1555803 [Tanacetum coccineum]